MEDLYKPIAPTFEKLNKRRIKQLSSKYKRQYYSNKWNHISHIILSCNRHTHTLFTEEMHTDRTMHNQNTSYYKGLGQVNKDSYLKTKEHSLRQITKNYY